MISCIDTEQRACVYSLNREKTKEEPEKPPALKGDHMTTFLLVLIYIAFISLGLPDAILGSAWPVLHGELGVSVSWAGILTMIVSGGTILSSFFSAKVISRFGTGKVTAVSVAMTAAGLLGYCFSPDFFWLCLFAVPLGLGAGAVDSSLNNFVALHYKATHMNWLHCFWGIGATAGPFLMSFFLLRENGWRAGYGTIGVLQCVLVVCLIASLPVWKKFEDGKAGETEEASGTDTGLWKLVKMPGAKPALLSFFCYCAVESSTGLWSSTFLVQERGLSPEAAARWVSLFYMGITAGRALAGFLAMKFNNKQMIRIGESVCILGCIFAALPGWNGFAFLGLIFIGLGCAPVYPAMLHDTPNRFGKEMSQGIMGIQMATAYVGATFMPPVLGVLGKALGFSVHPFFLLALAVLMLLTSERVNGIMNGKKAV